MRKYSASSADAKENRMKPEVRYERMRPGELAEARERASLVYVPIGSVEYHGHHVPVGFDTLNAQEACLRAAEQTGGVVAPATFWGTQGHVGFPGSLLLEKATVAAWAADVMEKLAGQKYRLIVFVTGHWGSVQGALIRQEAERFMAAGAEAKVAVLDVFTLDPLGREEHAGVWETSIALHLFPELVDMAALKEPGALHAIAPTCVDSTSEQGKAFFEGMVGGLVRAVREAMAGL